MPNPSDEKLLAEAEKLRAEARELVRNPFSRPTTWVPLFLAVGGAVGGLLTGYYQWQVKTIEVAEANTNAMTALLQAEQKKLDADRAAFDLEQNNKELQSTNQNLSTEIELKRQQVEQTKRDLAALQEQVNGASTALASNSTGSAAEAQAQSQLASANAAIESLAAELDRQTGTVYIQFKGGVSRETVRKLQTDLQALGYNVPGIERVSGDYGTEVRYFHPGDAALAEQASQDIAGLLRGACGSDIGVPSKQLTIRAPVGQVEAWLSLNC